eukprot:Phypoly_transcript_15187.p1 GENE.Phypoly_transcript_15187~~Phypoly_transcript_15187.p1  ORF type:complete len:269 (+),score=45.85 Phypoly_transcript_15187:65-808(+)
MEYLAKLDKQLIALGSPVDAKTIGLVLVSLIVVFITARLLFGRKKTKGDSILLLGDTNAGKTQIYLKLIHDVHHATQASMKLGEAVYKFDDQGKPKSVKLVDLPGHQRLRNQVQGLLGTAAGIVFVVDSADFKEQPVAGYLYELLVNKTVNKRDIPILVFLNKCDQERAWPESVIKSALEKELSELRRTRQAMPKAHGSREDEETIYLGLENKPFTFDQLPLSVTFAKGSIRNDDFSAVEDFIAERA